MQQLKNIGIVLGVSFSVFFISFMVLAWSPPSLAPTGGNITIPINESSSTQIKIGSLEIGGVFVTDSVTKLAQGNYSSTVTIGSSSTSSDLIVNGRITSFDDVCLNNGVCLTDIQSIYDNQMLVNGAHTFGDCLSLGGTLIDDDASSMKLCKFSGGCPSGWSQYKNWTTTNPNTCTVVRCYYPGEICRQCTTGSHSFSNRATEVCYYQPAFTWGGSTCAPGCATHCGSHSGNPCHCYASVVESGCY